MNHKMGFNPLSRTTAHRRAMSRNMVTSLFRFERITTTKAKAKEVRKSAEKLITRAKTDSVHNRREVAKFIQDESVLNKLFTVIGPRMKERAGGYTRILKLGFRQGDAADVVILELVDYKLKTESADAKKSSKEKGSSKSAEEKASKSKTESKTASKVKKETASELKGKKDTAKKAKAEKE